MLISHTPSALSHSQTQNLMKRGRPDPFTRGFCYPAECCLEVPASFPALLQGTLNSKESSCGSLAATLETVIWLSLKYSWRTVFSIQCRGPPATQVAFHLYHCSGWQLELP